MNKPILILFLFSLFAQVSIAQEGNTTALEKDLKKEKNLVVIDTVTKKRKAINPLAPSKAAFYSAILPGLGQIYNKKYWKAPIAIAAIGTAVYAYKWNDDRYKIFRTAFKRKKAGFTDLGDPRIPNDFSDEKLQDQQEKYQNDRDLMLLVSIAVYALNIIDANVDAHLKQFNIDNELSFDIKPRIEYNPITATPTYGMALTIKF
ncbi:MAG: DUF5683 domain-containing protein [Cellulophaga sp.]